MSLQLSLYYSLSSHDLFAMLLTQSQVLEHGHQEGTEKVFKEY